MYVTVTVCIKLSTFQQEIILFKNSISKNKMTINKRIIALFFIVKCMSSTKLRQTIYSTFNSSSTLAINDVLMRYRFEIL